MINDTKKEANIIIENSRTRCRNNIFIQKYYTQYVPNQHTAI